MEINFYKMKEIFGTEIFEIIKDNIDNVEQNNVELLENL